jgi:diguanylate cyclase (GGDEF)-like protein
MARPPDPNGSNFGLKNRLLFIVAIAVVMLGSICIAAVLTVFLFGPLIVVVVGTTILGGMAAWRYLKDPTSWRDSTIGFLAAIGVVGWTGFERILGAIERRPAVVPEERPVEEADVIAQSFQDPLTTLPNRALLIDRLEQALARAARVGRPIAVLFLDLDNFKEINDTLGHSAGDHLLISVAAVLETSMRASDTAARWGGDEFVLLLEDMRDPIEATLVAQRIMGALSMPFVFGEREVTVTASIGIAISSSPLDRPDELLHNADVAMYRAKHGGKNRIEIFDAAMNREVQERRKLAEDLRVALERGQFEVYYQPKVLLESGVIVGVEALLRWVRPDFGLVYPADFIPLAEETGQMERIGQWVLQEACRQARRWRFADPAPLVSVNLSRRQFFAAGLLDEVAGVLDRTQVDPRSLALEIPERVVMQDPDRSQVILQSLKDLGVKIVVDDFGASSSSLRYLRRLPIDCLKIDRSFMTGLSHESENSVIVSTLITLAHSLGLRVVAEGVETAAQASWLRAIDCDLAQGYYFAKPSGSRMTALLFESDISWLFEDEPGLPTF